MFNNHYYRVPIGHILVCLIYLIILIIYVPNHFKDYIFQYLILTLFIDCY